MSANPIYYKDLIQPDNSIQQAISELKALNKVYSELSESVKNNAITLQAEVRKSKSTTKESREEVEKMSYAARKLKQAQEELELAMSETGAQIQSLKNQAKEYNERSKQTDLLNRAEASSYKELAAQLKLAVAEYKELSAAEANSAKGQDLINKILALKASLKQYDDQMKLHIEKQKQVKQQLTAEEKARLKLQAALDGTTAKLFELNRQADIEAKKAKLQVIINKEKEGSYNSLSAQYSLNKIKLNAMSQAERETTETGKALVKETYEIYQAMIRAQEATGKYSLSVGNYKKHWDGFAVAVNQVIREVPAAAISLNTFFLGISNNIPLLVDEIQRLREQNKLLAADGKQQISVTGQLFKSIFSFNTLLIAGLTILAMHGDAIVDWIVSLFTGEKTVMSLNEQVEELNKTLAEGSSSYGQNITTYKRLKAEWSDLKSLKDREEWIKKNEDAFRQLDVACNDVNDADKLFVNNTSAVLEAFKNRAKAAAAMELAQKKYQEAFVKQEEARAKEAAGPNIWDRLYAKAAGAATSAGGPSIATDYETTFKNTIKSIKQESKDLESTADSYFKMAEGYQALADAVLGNYEGKDKSGKGRKKQPKDATDYLDRTSTSVQKKYLESITKLEEEEFAKRRKETLETYNTETAALYDKYNKTQRILENENKEYKALTDEQKEQVKATQETILRTIVNYQKQLSQDLEDIESERQIRELETVQQTIDLRLQAVKQGSEEELRLKLQSIENERKIAILQNRLKPVSEQAAETDINASYTASRSDITTSYNLSSFEQQQALEEAKFNAVYHNELQITKFKLEQEKERWNKQIALAEAGALDWSETQIEAAREAVKGINKELDEISGFKGFVSSVGEKGLGGAFLQQLGFDDKSIDAMNTATDTILSNIQSIMQAEVDAAQAAVEAAQERVDAANTVFEAELEARQNGYANSVDTAREELELEKKRQKEKEKLLADAQKRQQKLDTVMQTSSLITASANIWSSMSKVPIIGPALALAAIASMWVSFAAAKVKAKQATQEAQEYGEGGFEILEGGSHASGNDIDLGVTNSKHKRMKAEGGEALAIINKRQTAKYKKILPDIISSINKGTFEDKYTKLNDVSVPSVSFVQEPTDLSKIEESLDSIRRQNENTIATLPDGTIIERGRNSVRRIKG